jgi:hypothetical protein
LGGEGAGIACRPRSEETFREEEVQEDAEEDPGEGLVDGEEEQLDGVAIRPSSASEKSSLDCGEALAGDGYLRVRRQRARLSVRDKSGS